MRPSQVRLIRQPTIDVIDLGRADATNADRLLAASRTSDITDAHVVICARRAAQLSNQDNQSRSRGV